MHIGAYVILRTKLDATFYASLPIIPTTATTAACVNWRHHYPPLLYSSTCTVAPSNNLDTINRGTCLIAKTMSTMVTKVVLLIALVTLCDLGVVSTFTPTFPKSAALAATRALYSNNEIHDDKEEVSSCRRNFLEQTAASTLIVTAGAFSSMISARFYAFAEDDNEFIRELKARSDANREKYNKQAGTGEIGVGRIDYSQKSKYEKPRYVGIRRLDGSYKMVSPEVAQDWQNKGLVIAEYDVITSDKLGTGKVDYKNGLVFKFKDEKSQSLVDKSKPIPAPSPTPSSPHEEIKRAEEERRTLAEAEARQQWEAVEMKRSEEERSASEKQRYLDGEQSSAERHRLEQERVAAKAAEDERREKERLEDERLTAEIAERIRREEERLEREERLAAEANEQNNVK